MMVFPSWGYTTQWDAHPLLSLGLELANVEGLSGFVATFDASSLIVTSTVVRFGPAYTKVALAQSLIARRVIPHFEVWRTPAFVESLAVAVRGSTSSSFNKQHRGILDK